jgi:DNA repair exonuclease SbcCD ATPase subunit
MKIKHKLLADFQYLSNDKKIFILKSGTILEEYIYKVKNELIPIDKAIIDNNPEFFEVLDYKVELLSYLKANKIPQPAQLQKKLIPFMEEMLLSSINQNQQTGPVVDEAKVRELERKELDLNSRERRIKDKEDDVEVRMKRVEKRESEWKEEMKSLDRKEDELRQKSREVQERELDVQDKLQDINERERNLDLNILKSSQDIDSKYKELQDKINADLKAVSEREREVEVKQKKLSRLESELSQKDADIQTKLQELENRIESAKEWENELKNLDKEIKDWEGLHWKFKRNQRPPSTIID